MPRYILLVSIFLIHAESMRGDETSKPSVTADQALSRLRDGNRRFVADKMATRDTFLDQRARLAKGQQPFAIVLACADSRVVPELLFNQQLGDLFVVRVAGNVTDPVVLGSIEYAVEHLHSPLVIVLGHSKCGAVKAAVDGGPTEGNLGALVKQVHLGGDLPKDKDAAVAAGVRANVLYQVEQMTKKSTVLKDFAGSGRVRLMGGVYSLDTGEVEWLKAK